MIYKAVRGSILSDKEAQRYGERIAVVIEEKGGGVTPEDILADAKQKVSPLHPFFDWNDKTAAMKYRVHMAGYLIRSIQVVIKKNEHEEERRAFYNVFVKSEATDENERVYVRLERVTKEEDLRQQVIDQALAYLKTWQGKYKLYKESVLAPVFVAIDEALEKVPD